jgi:hypothetical protein
MKHKGEKGEIKIKKQNTVMDIGRMGERMTRKEKA